MSDFLLSQPLFTDDSAAMIVAEYLQILNLQTLLDDTHYSQKNEASHRIDEVVIWSKCYRHKKSLEAIHFLGFFYFNNRFLWI